MSNTLLRLRRVRTDAQGIPDQAGLVLDFLHGLARRLQAKFAVLLRRGAEHDPLVGVQHLELPIARRREENQKPRQRGRHALLLTLALASCKTVHTLEASQQADTELHREVQSGPEHIVMTVEEFSRLCDPKEEAHGSVSGGDIGPASGTRVWPVGEASRLTPVQALVRRTVTVTDRGPSLETLNELSRTQFKLNEKDESKPGGIFSLWFLVGLLPLVAGVLVWRLKPSLFGVAFGAIKSLFGRKAS